MTWARSYQCCSKPGWELDLRGPHPSQLLLPDVRDSLDHALSRICQAQEQKEQLHVMLKRPSVDAEAIDEEAKRRKTEPGNAGSCR